MIPPLAAVLFALAVASPAAPSVAGTGAQDSTTLVLFARDSATRVALTADALDFDFTDRGARRTRRATDSAVTAGRRRAVRAGRSEWFDADALVRSITDGVVRGMHVRFPLDAVDEVRTEGDELTVCFRPATPDAPRCAAGKRFVFTGTTPGDVRRFADALDRAVAQAR